MARAVTANSFPLTTAPHAQLAQKRKSQLTVFAKNGGLFPNFGIGKPDSNESSESSEAGNTANGNPFQFNWGKISDVKSLIPVVSSPPVLAGSIRGKEAGTVFVAGALGLTGLRITGVLLREGFRVRAGVPDLSAAQGVASFASAYKIISAEEAKRLNAVKAEFDDAESIAKAIGNASKAVLTIGPTEYDTDVEVTMEEALQVVEAAQLAGVGHIVIIYDEPAPISTSNVLGGISSFFNNLFSKSKPLTVAEFLEKVIQTNVKYTFIRTSLTDDFAIESSYNVVVAAEGSDGENVYKVSRLDVAALAVGLLLNTDVAEDKVVNVYTDPSAPSRSLDELFSVIPEDGRRKAYAEAIARAKAEEEALKATEQAREAAEAKKKLEEELKILEEQEARAATLAEEAQQKAEEAGSSPDSFLNKAKDLGSGFSFKKFGSQLASVVKTPTIETPKVQIATVRGQAKALNLPSQKAVIKQTTPEPKPKLKPKPTPKLSYTGSEEEEKPEGKDVKTEVRNIFGGLFKQETIYIDDD